MPDFRQTRTPVARWREFLVLTYNKLVELGANDVWVYGSQAMSLYMKRPLASKDLDLLASGTTIDMIKRLCESLAALSSNQRKPNWNYLELEHEGFTNPVFSIYINAQNERPFVIELFQTYNGHNLRELTAYSAYVKRWENEFQTLTVEAIVGTRLAFRPPERISTFNAQRLNSFIKAVKVDWSKVERFANAFHLEERIEENLRGLRRRKIKIRGSDQLTFLS
jgi:hypothetical protein